MNTIKTRNITVAYFPDGKCGRIQATGEIKPMIRIANRYLSRAGFKVGDRAEINYSKELITIRKTLELYDYNNNC
jgi:hypothetical protein